MDLTKLPVGEAIIGFLLFAVVVSMGIAYYEVQLEDGEAEETATAEPTDGATDGPTGSPGPGDGAVEVVMTDNAFDPDEITVPAGETVTFTVVNEGNATHNMHIAGENGEYDQAFCDATGEDPCSDPNTVGAGEEATLEWEVPDTPGEEVDFRCDFHVADMTGTITIE